LSQKKQRLLEIIEELDKIVPTKGAIVKLDQYGGGPDEGRIVANKSGYLRLGIEFLKAAFAAPIVLEDNKEEDIEDIEIKLNDLIAHNSDIHFDWFQRTENIQAQKYKPTFWSDRVVPFLLLTCLISIVIFSIIGFVSLVMIFW